MSAWKVQDGPGGFESEAAAWRHQNDATTVTARLVTADDSTTTVVRHPGASAPEEKTLCANRKTNGKTGLWWAGVLNWAARVATRPPQ